MTVHNVVSEVSSFGWNKKYWLESRSGAAGIRFEKDRLIFWNGRETSKVLCKCTYRKSKGGLKQLLRIGSDSDVICAESSMSQARKQSRVCVQISLHFNLTRCFFFAAPMTKWRML